MTLSDRLMTRMQQAGIPGLAVGVIRQGELVLAEGYGTTATEDGRPVTADTLFRIGSVTKPLVATAIMRLAEAGTLELDRPVTAYLPRLRWGDPEGEQITLRMLLTHTSGLPAQPVAFAGARDPEGLERYVHDELTRLPLAQAPGMLYTYANSGYALAGCVAAAASGRSFQAMMQRLLFDPLGMGRSTFDPLMALTYRTALAHTPGPDGGLQVRRPIGEHTGFQPAGGAFSTVQDLARFALLHLREGMGLLSPAILRAMHVGAVETYGITGGRQALGFGWSRPMGRARLSHGGQVDGYQSLLVLYPEECSAIIILANWLEAEGSLLPFRLLLAQDVLGHEDDRGWTPASVEPDRSRWPAYQGDYLSPQAGLLQIRVVADRLMAVWNGEEMALEALGPRHYMAGRKFGLGFPGDPGLALFNSGVYRRIDSTGVDEAKPLSPEIEGEYGLRHGMWLRIEAEALLLYSSFYRREVHCVPIGDDRFACPWGWFAATRGADGRVSGINWAGERLSPRRSDANRPGGAG